MTKWAEQTLRPHGQAWPGLDTRGGELDDGRGWLRDGSKNVQINREDTLSKRSGMVRGLDEWFGAVVCGLFSYQDNCGNEYLLVADEDGINIRQPFELPQFTASDAYPNDTFDGDGAINVSNWRNTSRYVRVSDRFAQATGASSFVGQRIAPDLFMRWFKDAGALAYQVQLTYRFDPSLLEEQRVGIIIRGNGDLTTGAFLQADIVFDGSAYKAVIYHRDAQLQFRELASVDLDGITTDPRGTFTFKQERDLNASTFKPVVTVLPNQGTFTTLEAPSIARVEDADLGLVSAIAAAQKAGSVSQLIGADLVLGGAI